MHIRELGSSSLLHITFSSGYNRFDSTFIPTCLKFAVPACRLFHDDTFKSFYRRLCFSPDGELVVVPSGVLDVEGEAATPHCTYVFARNNLTK